MNYGFALGYSGDADVQEAADHGAEDEYKPRQHTNGSTRPKALKPIAHPNSSLKPLEYTKMVKYFEPCFNVPSDDPM